LQLKFVVAVLLCANVSWADGEVTVTGAYYKERSTRVIQPMLDARLDVGESGEVAVHALVDSITSASAAAGASGTAFNEKRYETGGLYLHRSGRYRFGGGYRFSTESDYLSMFALLRGSAELADKNATLSISLGQGHDRLNNQGSQTPISNPIEGTLNTTLASASVSQILTPLVVAAVGYDFSYLSGTQENLYRVVVAGGVVEGERVPDDRYRHTLYTNLRGFMPATRSTLAIGYRFYFDDWGILGHTPEVRWIQEIVGGVDAHLRYRYHFQTGADFFKDIYDTADPAMEPYLTDDEKLSRHTSHGLTLKTSIELGTLGAKGRMGRSRAIALVEYVFQSTDFGNAFISQVGMEVPIDY
jgi:hypothetical protein